MPIYKNFKTLNVLLVLLGVLFLGDKASAHALQQSYIFLSIDAQSIQGRVEINIVDLNQALNLGLPTDKSATKQDIAPHVDKIKQYFYERIDIKLGEGLVLQDYHLYSIPKVQFLAFDFVFDGLDPMPQQIDFEYTVLFDKLSDHTGFVVVENDWRNGVFNDEGNIALVFTPNETTKRLDLSGSTVSQGYIEMVKLGIHHIIDGIDHILFLFALLLPSVLSRVEKQWQASDKFYPAFIYVVKIVTVFTIAHTITLSAATLGFMSLSSRLVESIIAISIAIAALDMLTPIFRGRIWLIIFCFGLFHGFGFASVLSEYPIPDSYLTLSLLSFNIGVELGQVTIVAIVFPILYVLRKQSFYIPVILKAGAVILIVIAMYWFVERAFAIDLPAGAIWNRVLGMFG